MTEEMKKCPFCGKEINVNAKKCIHCYNWVDDAIKCPTCGETINASAKICRFCKEPVKKQLKTDFNFSIPAFNKIDFKSKSFIIGACSVFALLILFIVFNLTYIPDCSSPSVLTKVKDNTQREIGKLSSIKLITEGIQEVKRNDDGYNCSIPVLIDGVDTAIYYKYRKEGFKINLDSNFQLPDCFSGAAKQMVRDIINKSYKDDNVSDRVKSVDITFVTSNTDKKEIYEAEKIECTGTVQTKLKAGWTYNNKDTRSNDIDYSIYFCDNEFTPCVTVYNERNWK